MDNLFILLGILSFVGGILLVFGSITDIVDLDSNNFKYAQITLVLGLLLLTSSIFILTI